MPVHKRVKVVFFGRKTEKLKREVSRKKSSRIPEERRKKISNAMKAHWADENFRSIMVEYANTRTPEQIQRRLEEMQYELEHSPEGFFNV